MLTDQELLQEIRETTMMGRIGIDAVMRYSPCQPLTDALRQQKAEYGELLNAATALLREKGGNPAPLPLGARIGTAMSRAKSAVMHPSASEIAGMMITGNTRGVVTALRRQKQHPGRDRRVVELSRKLLETEEHNIRQMKGFL